MGGTVRCWLVAGVMSLGSATARAGDAKTSFPPCTTTPTDADRKAAQGAFLAGHGSFNEGDYATAITYWRDAYRRDCTAHLMLVNLARAYELQGERAEALGALETYLERKSDASDAEQIRRRVENLKSQIASAAPPDPAPPIAAPSPAAPANSDPAPPPADAEATPSRNRVPIIVAAGGGVVAVIGLAVLGGGAGKVADAEKACPARTDCTTEVADQGNQGRSQEKTGGFLFVAGAIVGAGGLVWYLAAGAPARTAQAPRGVVMGQTQVMPVVGSGFTGLSVMGKF